MDVGDPKILEKGENNLRHIVGGRSGKSRLEMNASPNHLELFSPLTALRLTAGGTPRQLSTFKEWSFDMSRAAT